MQCIVEVAGPGRSQSSDMKVIHADAAQCMLPIGLRGRVAMVEAFMSGLAKELVVKPAVEGPEVSAVATEPNPPAAVHVGAMRAPAWWTKEMGPWPVQHAVAEAPTG